LAAITQNIKALKYASEELKDNPTKQGNHDLSKPNSLKMLKSAIKRFLESL
jgi:hypothetical protein